MMSVCAFYFGKVSIQHIKNKQDITKLWDAQKAMRNKRYYKQV